MRGNFKQRVHLHVVGGGVMGLMVVIRAIELFAALGFQVTCSLYEQALLGGSPADGLAAAVRSQLWCHRFGMIFAATQRVVAKNLRHSVRQLRRYVPNAFNFILDAYAVVPQRVTDLGIDYESEIHDLRIPFCKVTRRQLARREPAVKLHRHSRVFRIAEGTFRYPILVAGLRNWLRHYNATIVPHGVVRVERTGAYISALILDNGQKVVLEPHDQLVLACGARMINLAAAIGLSLPLSTYQSSLIATTEAHVQSLLAVIGGGSTLVPHRLRNGDPILVGGNAGRVACPPGAAPRPDHAACDLIRSQIQDDLGIVISEKALLTWPAVKTEISVESGRCQSHFAAPLPGMQSAWYVIPGKLSGTATAADDLVLQILESIDDRCGYPVFEMLAAADARNNLQPFSYPRAA